jgi:hypothetical protein
MSFREIIVISDVHLSVDRGGWFQADIPLKNFFQWVIEEAKGSHLVLNGDIFDFLANNSEPGVNPADAEQQVAAIAKSHPEVFGALSNIINYPRRKSRSGTGPRQRAGQVGERTKSLLPSSAPSLVN